MPLKEEISKELTVSMKQHDTIKTSAFRNILSKLTELEKTGKGVTPEDEQKILRTTAKQIKEEIDSFKQYNRIEHLDERETELHIVESYLPQQMNEEEIIQYVNNFLTTTEHISNPNKVIGMIMKELKGKADGNVVKQIVEKSLVVK